MGYSIARLPTAGMCTHRGNSAAPAAPLGMLATGEVRDLLAGLLSTPGFVVMRGGDAGMWCGGFNESEVVELR